VHLCEMCEVILVRFVHTMSHLDYETLDVGCICAGHMEEDLIGAHKREAGFKNRSSRRAHWLTREWRTSYAGNNYINTDGFNIVVYPTGATWGARVKHRESGQERLSRRPYASPEHAKLAAFDVMLQMKLQLEGAKGESQNEDDRS
jgi:hypothetical protein